MHKPFPNPFSDHWLSSSLHIRHVLKYYLQQLVKHLIWSRSLNYSPHVYCSRTFTTFSLVLAHGENFHSDRRKNSKLRFYYSGAKTEKQLSCFRTLAERLSAIILDSGIFIFGRFLGCACMSVTCVWLKINWRYLWSF